MSSSKPHLDVTRAYEPGDTAVEQAAVEPAVAPGKQIGPFKLLETLGEGGMGIVYLVEQEEPVRRRWR
jgi:hypothetical protein